MLTFKTFLILFFVLIVVGVGFLYTRREKTLVGNVIDCESGEPISDVLVSVNQRGWGITEGSIVWDRDFITNTKSDNGGHYIVKYRVGKSAYLRAEKEGYIPAEWYTYSDKNVVLRMRKEFAQPVGVVTYDCKLSSECLQTTIDDGIKVTRNTCI